MDRNQRSRSYYTVLGIRPDSSGVDIRRAYRNLAMKWHPDRFAREPLVADEAKKTFQQIQEAYEVLSDRRKRTLYDTGIYDPYEEDDRGEEVVEGFSDFVQEMLKIMADVRREEKSYSLEELQVMLNDMMMAQGFDSSPPSNRWFSGCDTGSCRESKKRRCDVNQTVRRGSF